MSKVLPNTKIKPKAISIGRQRKAKQGLWEEVEEFFEVRRVE